VVRVGHQIAAGLAAAHAQGVVHRDIKPGNILLENGLGRIVITDFGLAQAADECSLTHTGTLAGTPHYMSPEQADARPLDHRSDLFSLGSVLYFMASGRVPYRGDRAMSVLRSICEEEPQPLRAINPDVPAALEALIARLHAKSPDDRFTSAAEVRDLLADYLAHLQQPLTLPLPPTFRILERSRRPGSRSTRRWLLVGAAAVAVSTALWPFTGAPLGLNRTGDEQESVEDGTPITAAEPVQLLPLPMVDEQIRDVRDRIDVLERTRPDQKPGGRAANDPVEAELSTIDAAVHRLETATF